MARLRNITECRRHERSSGVALCGCAHLRTRLAFAGGEVSFRAV